MFVKKLEDIVQCVAQIRRICNHVVKIFLCLHILFATVTVQNCAGENNLLRYTCCPFIRSSIVLEERWSFFRRGCSGLPHWYLFFVAVFHLVACIGIFMSILCLHIIPNCKRGNASWSHLNMPLQRQSLKANTGHVAFLENKRTRFLSTWTVLAPRYLVLCNCFGIRL